MPSAEARFQQAMRAFEEQAARMASLKEQLAGLKGSARNSDGSVTVTVAPSGAVLGLTLSPEAMRRTHTQLQQEILGTIRRATEQAAQAMEDTVRPVIGERYDQFQQALGAHAGPVEPLGPTTPPPAETLPAPLPAGTNPAPQASATSARSARPSADDDDDYYGNPVYGGNS
jgi:DNA-binding protein YbaB